MHSDLSVLVSIFTKKVKTNNRKNKEGEVLCPQNFTGGLGGPQKSSQNEHIMKIIALPLGSCISWLVPVVGVTNMIVALPFWKVP